MTTLMPIQRAAIFQVDQVRSLIVVGARSLFQRGLPETSLRSSSKSRCVMAMSEAVESAIDLPGDSYYAFGRYCSRKLTVTCAVMEIRPGAIALSDSRSDSVPATLLTF